MNTIYQPRWEIHASERQEILRQIGVGNLLSISGGRVTALADGVELPVSSGFRVRVHLTPADEYVVERIFVRNDKKFLHGQTKAWTDTVGELAYRAGMYRSYDADEWTIV